MYVYDFVIFTFEPDPKTVNMNQHAINKRLYVGHFRPKVIVRQLADYTVLI